MKITITQTIIELDIPDQPQEQKAKKPPQPFSFLEMLCREVERAANPQPLEFPIHGPFLAQ